MNALGAREQAPDGVHRDLIISSDDEMMMMKQKSCPYATDESTKMLNLMVAMKKIRKSHFAII